MLNGFKFDTVRLTTALSSDHVNSVGRVPWLAGLLRQLELRLAAFLRQTRLALARWRGHLRLLDQLVSSTTCLEVYLAKVDAELARLYRPSKLVSTCLQQIDEVELRLTEMRAIELAMPSLQTSIVRLFATSVALGGPDVSFIQTAHTNVNGSIGNSSVGSEACFWQANDCSSSFAGGAVSIFTNPHNIGVSTPPPPPPFPIWSTAASNSTSATAINPSHSYGGPSLTRGASANTLGGSASMLGGSGGLAQAGLMQAECNLFRRINLIVPRVTRMAKRLSERRRLLEQAFKENKRVRLDCETSLQVGSGYDSSSKFYFRQYIMLVG
ncbi:unnamed protein product [Protopolystoma xenopodis]|uniref:Uncharacterized protein n=1 Tax=Protopolystoma xenopodis TaxID=117903 RepID=A0A448XQP8_9PLAT|nr:unnamed protein product [Protopolystoma xenopodis]